MPNTPNNGFLGGMGIQNADDQALMSGPIRSIRPRAYEASEGV